MQFSDSIKQLVEKVQAFEKAHPDAAHKVITALGDLTQAITTRSAGSVLAVVGDIQDLANEFKGG